MTPFRIHAKHAQPYTRSQVAERRLEAAEEDARRDIEMADLKAQENELRAQVRADPLLPAEDK